MTRIILLLLILSTPSIATPENNSGRRFVDYTTSVGIALGIGRGLLGAAVTFVPPLWAFVTVPVFTTLYGSVAYVSSSFLAYSWKAIAKS